MAKFAVQCPHCSSVSTASTFLFAKKVIVCGSCGKEFDVRTARLATRICPKCGNEYVYDQAKNTCVCPVCNTKENVAEAVSKNVTINCPQCSCAIEVGKGAPVSFCPLCDFKIDVDKELKKKEMRKDFISEIRFRGNNNMLVWKSPVEDFNLGSRLIVGESQEAIFFSNGQALDMFGPGPHELKTENIPLLRRQFEIMPGKNTPFHSEVYFINKEVAKHAIKWGTNELISFTEPFSGLPLKLGVHGTMSLQVSDSRRLLVKIIGAESGLNWDDGSELLRQMYMPWIKSAIKAVIPVAIKSNNLDVLDLNAEHEGLEQSLKERLSELFADYGFSLAHLNIEGIFFPEDDENYRLLLAKRTERSKAKLDISNMGDLTESEVLREKYEEAKTARLMREAQGRQADAYAAGMMEADIMKAKGLTGNDILGAEVEKAKWSAIGQAGSNASGGGGGGGMASDLIGMMMGAKIAGSIAGQFDTNGAPKPAAAQAAQPAAEAGWTCACGATNNGKFCTTCGSPKPEQWTCSCGATNAGKFCTNCGNPKPERWTCSCGATNTGKFCVECGNPKPVIWTCPSCGAQGNRGKCCSECGTKRPE